MSEINAFRSPWCDADQTPAGCVQNGYRHVCEHLDDHDGHHECACGHQWTEADHG